MSLNECSTLIHWWSPPHPSLEQTAWNPSVIIRHPPPTVRRLGMQNRKSRSSISSTSNSCTSTYITSTWTSTEHSPIIRTQGMQNRSSISNTSTPLLHLLLLYIPDTEDQACKIGIIFPTYSTISRCRAHWKIREYSLFEFFLPVVLFKMHCTSHLE